MFKKVILIFLVLIIKWFWQKDYTANLEYQKEKVYYDFVYIFCVLQQIFS